MKMRKSLCAVLLLTPFLIKAQPIENRIPIDSIQMVKNAEIRISPIVSHNLTTNIVRNSIPLLVPAGMFGFGAVAIHNNTLRNIDLSIRSSVLAESHRSVSSNVDNVLQYVPAYSVFALNAVGLKSESNFIDRMALFGISNTIMSHSVAKLKRAYGKLRPDGSNKRSFPSGHAATAFSAAEFMRLEYKDSSPIYGIAAYTIAATTGALRIYRNSHWFSDVVAGAGIGILSTKLTYFAYPKVKKFVSKTIRLKSKDLHVAPTYQNGTAGFSLVYKP